MNQALGDKGALAEESALIREFKGDFDIEVAASRQMLAFRMGTSDVELDRGKIQAEVLKLVKEGKYPNTKDGMRQAIRDVAAPRVAVAAQMESLFRARGVPPHLARGLAAKALDRAMAIFDDTSISYGDAVNDKLNTLATEFAEGSKDFFARSARRPPKSTPPRSTPRRRRPSSPRSWKARWTSRTSGWRCGR